MQFGTLIANNVSTFYIAIAVITLTTIYYFYTRRGLPPGPIGLPFLGYWPFLKNDTCHLQLHELGKKYGPVYSFTTTGRLYVNIGSHKVLREAHITKSECFADRLEDFSPVGRYFQDGVGFLNGEKWKVNRKFFLQQFRERGVNNLGNVMGSMHDTIQETVHELRGKRGGPVDVVDMFTTKCSKVLLFTVFGESSSFQEIKELVDIYCNVVEVFTGPNMLMTGNVVRYLILPFMRSFNTSLKHIVHMEDKLQKMIDYHRSTLDEANPRDFVDAYLKEGKVREAKNDPTAECFKDKHLKGSLVQFIGDGVLTVAAFIGAFFKALLDYPEEQDKIHRELIEVLGEDVDPNMEDKNKLLYTNAFFTEVCRTTDIFPFFPKMECTKETTLCGYRIPKGSMTIMNIWSAHYDPLEYEEPEKFNPSRFMTVAGKKKPEQPVLFGIGKRACLGEGYAMAQVFLFVTTVIKHFHVTKPAGTEKESLLFLAGKFHICAVPRVETK